MPQAVLLVSHWVILAGRACLDCFGTALGSVCVVTVVCLLGFVVLLCEVVLGKCGESLVFPTQEVLTQCLTQTGIF